MAANLPTTDSSYVQMVILTDDRHKEPLTQEEASEIEKYIFDQVCDIRAKSPRFKGRYEFSKEDGAIIINTHVDSVSWLKEVIGSYEPKALSITDIKNSPQYTAKVRADISSLALKSVDDLFELLEAHNVGLKTDGWRTAIICEYCYDMITSVIFLIDDPGKKMLEENGFELSVGFSTIKFILLRRVKRSETTGKICMGYF